MVKFHEFSCFTVSWRRTRKRTPKIRHRFSEKLERRSPLRSSWKSAVSCLSQLKSGDLEPTVVTCVLAGAEYHGDLDLGIAYPES